MRQAVRVAASPACGLCGLPIAPGEAFEVDHRVPLGLGGSEDDSNLEPLHIACHKTKTAADLRSIAKAKRIKAKHDGTYPPSGRRIRSRGFVKRGAL
jgi:5-methylcytosine-specific restriction endonuclease McrA